MKKALSVCLLTVYIALALLPPAGKYSLVPAARAEESSSSLAVSPTALAFSFRQGGSLPPAQSLSVTSRQNVSFTAANSSGASWLSLSRTSGTTPSSIGVAVNPGSLAAGTYSASITISSYAGNVSVPVKLTVTAATGLVVSPTSLAFTYQQGGTLPSSKSLSVTSSSTVISFTDSKSATSWLSLSRTSGTTPSSIGVSVAPGSLAVGTYTGSVAVSSSVGSTTVPVTLTVTTSSGTGGGTTSGTYALLAWSELGMHCMDGKDYSVFSVLPPYNTIYAKLLTKGSQPTPVTSGVTVTYQAIADVNSSINTTSAGTSTIPAKTNFWNWVYLLFGGQPPADIGLHNYPVQSLTPHSMTYDSTKGLWKAEGIPTAPVDDAGKTNAYPMAKLVATNSSGQVIAQSTVVLAVSDEMSCKNCHASGSNAQAMPPGGWVNYTTDPAKDVKLNILKLHDRVVIPATMLTELKGKGYNYQSSLYATASQLNNPILCASCHSSNALNAAGLSTGVTGVPPLTTSMHQQHASVTLPGSTTTLDNATSPAGSCYLCHPGQNTKCQRGAMSGVACYNCHGNLSRLAVSTRAGWLNEPACQMCHQNSASYTTAFTSTNIGPSGTWRTSTDMRFATNNDVPSAGLNLYRFSKGHGSVECSGCHGSQHGEYPTNQPNDNVYSQYLQGYAGKLTECTVCHATAPMTANGGPHGMHTVGSTWVSGHHNYISQVGLAACAYCHGADYRGTVLSKLLTAKTLAGKSFPAGHQMNCYDCHNGPNGD